MHGDDLLHDKKGYKLPNEKEIEECTREAAKHLFK